MRIPLRSFTLSRLARVAGVLWLCATGPAWAGGGGEDAPSLQSLLDAFCGEVGIPAKSCPQLPTAAQIAIESAGLTNSQPDEIRDVFFNTVIFPYCGNLFSGTGIPCTQIAINAVNAPVKSLSSGGPLAIPYLTPLAFKPGAVVTQYGDPAATRFLYGSVLEGGQPQVLDLILDDTSDTNKQFSMGPVVAFNLPLVIFNSSTDTETPVSATLQLTATCNGAASCLTGTVTFSGGKQTYSAAALGLTFTTSFDMSPNSTTAHKKYDLQVPIIATPSTDPGYFPNALSLSCPKDNAGNPLSGYCNAFSTEQLGFPAPVLGSGASIGVAPYAAPLCPGNTCLSTPPSTTFFGFCATFADANVPAVATFFQIGTDGATTMTTPVSATGIQCPS